MVNYAAIQHKIDVGLGKAGAKLGQPYTAYRVTSASSGDFPSGWAVMAAGVPIFRRRVAITRLEDAFQYGGGIWYDLIGDLEPFLLGDTFLSTDAPYDPGVSYGAGAQQVVGSTYELNGFAFAWHAPVQTPIGGRIDRRGQIFRAPETPTPYGSGDGSAVFRQALDAASPLVLVNGAYSFVDRALNLPANFVPVGISAISRPPRGENFKPDVPGMPGMPRYFAYLPYLPGYEAASGDRIETEDGARYVVVDPYRQEQGATGNQLALERMIDQAA